MTSWIMKWILDPIKHLWERFLAKIAQLTSTCSKSAIETLEKEVKYVQS